MTTWQGLPKSQNLSFWQGFHLLEFIQPPTCNSRRDLFSQPDIQLINIALTDIPFTQLIIWTHGRKPQALPIWQGVTIWQGLQIWQTLPSFFALYKDDDD
jgi:hypothetical protein